MPDTPALAVVKALLRNLRVTDPELFLEDEPEAIRQLVAAADERLRDTLREEAEQEDEYPDDEELEPLVADRRLAYWSALLTDDQALESAVYAVEEALPGLVDEMVGFCAMVVSRQPALAEPIAAARARFAQELGAILAPRGVEAPRQCYAILPGQSHPELGYVPSLVTEGEAGHQPLVGRGELSAPWYWGTDFDQAQRLCDQANAETFHLTPAEARAIVESSITASIRTDHARDTAAANIDRALGRRAGRLMPT